MTEFDCTCVPGCPKCIGCRANEAVRAAVAEERAKWVAACMKAFDAGYQDQGWTIIYEMGAADEVPKDSPDGGKDADSYKLNCGGTRS